MKAKNGVLFLFLLVGLFSCSTKKDTFINRNYHAVTAEFNTLYNGQNAFNKGLEDLNSKFVDDYWNLIPIEPIRFEEQPIRIPQLGGPGASFNNNSSNQNNKSSTFERAEEKATKAIQKHSIRIRGVEKNPQIDDAFLLLGKSRYYTQRFIPAIEAFNYIIKKYPKAKLIDETKIWKAKSNIRLENEDIAVESLLNLLKKDKLTANIREQANTALAMAYQKKDSIKAVIDRLKRAVRVGVNPIQRARNQYLLGQIFSGQNEKDSARTMFEKLGNDKKAPYKFRLRAIMALANEAQNDSSVISLINRYEDMLGYWDHRKSIDIIEYHQGILEEKLNDKKKAIESYKNAVSFQEARPKIKSYSYERLAELYFSMNKFSLASLYYDSVLKIDVQETLRTKKIRRKYNSLSDLIKYENIVKKNDSIIKIILLEPDERIAYFESYIESIKKEDDEKRKLAEKSMKGVPSFERSGGTQSRKKDRGKWYFYNQESLSFGEGEFKRIWGNRALQDNWRWSQSFVKQQVTRNNLSTNSKSTQVGPTANVEATNKYDLNSYLSRIPTETIVIDSIADERVQALYELGLMYSERFERDQMAIDRLERLLKSYPPKRLVLPTYFLLYELYGKQKESKGIFYKRSVLRKYPTTAYSRVIKARDGEPNSDQEIEEIKKLYEASYKMYDKGNYEQAAVFIEQSLETIDNSPLIPKFELLKAYCIGKYASKKQYKKALDKVFKDYPNSIEGRKASSISKKL